MNEESKEILESKVDLICNLYKALTNRKLAIEFRKEQSYISLPQTKRRIKKAKRKPRPAKN